MNALNERRPLCAAILAVTLVSCVGVAWASETPASSGGPAAVALNDPNELRWDLAEKFEFDWDSVELSAKALKGGTSDAAVYTLTIDMRVDILDAERLVTIDVNRPEIAEVYDGDGRMVEYLRDPVLPVRRYEERGWYWDGIRVNTPQQWHPGRLVLRLPGDPNHAVPSSISRLTAYIHVIYGEVIKADVPFEARGAGWLNFKNIPDLWFRIDSSTPPPPEPINPQQAIALYKYKTLIKSESGQPVMAVDDVWGRYPRDLYPFGDYAIVRTELFDSQRKVTVCFSNQWVLSCLAGSYREGAYCWGQMEQDDHTYDMIRHVIIGRPVEVRIPFVLTNIPVPGVQCADN